jgi:hypothetical protein
MNRPSASDSIKPDRMEATIRPVPANSGTALVRWPMKNPSGPLQFWRLSRRLELQRGHGRLLIHGNGYWK